MPLIVVCASELFGIVPKTVGWTPGVMIGHAKRRQKASIDGPRLALRGYVTGLPRDASIGVECKR